MIEVNLPNPEVLADNFGFVKLAYNFDSNVKGILNATVTVIASTQTYADCKVTLDCGATDLYDLYADDLADTDLWKPKNNSGVAVTPSNVAKTVATKSWRVTANFAAGTYTIELTTPALLAADDIGAPPANGIETPVATSFTTTS
jgi:hypothetical protein